PLLLFYYCYAHHRDLHSFPTRRSSDLEVFLHSRRDRLRRAVRHHRVEQAVAARPVDFVLGEPQPLPAVSIISQVEINFERPAAEDRKSTRLNSSHVSISYAVFCLKKKR